MNYYLLSLVAGTAMTFTGCAQMRVSEVTLQERLLLRPNPTNYVFEAGVSDVKGAIKGAFAKWQEDNSSKYHGQVWRGAGDATTKHVLSLAIQLIGNNCILWKEGSNAPTKYILTKPGNQNDAYVYGGDAPFGESQVYFKDGQPLIYFADFHIHLTAVDSRRTRVDIFTDNSCVAAGVDERWSPHGPAIISVKVEQTTVEQYQILLRIGEQLGRKDMPPLVTPGPDAPVKELTKPKDR